MKLGFVLLTNAAQTTVNVKVTNSSVYTLPPLRFASQLAARLYRQFQLSMQ